MASTLDVILLWFMCRRHILEVHISHFMYALTGIKTKGPRKTLFMNLQKAWPEIQDKLDCNNLTKFDCSKLRVGSSIYNIVKSALQYGESALKIGVFFLPEEITKSCVSLWSFTLVAK